MCCAFSFWRDLALEKKRYRVDHVLLRNPLVQACIVRLALNLFGIPLPVFVAQLLDMIGHAALGVGLLVVGAGISLRRLRRWNWQVAIGALLRPILSPMVFGAIAMLFGLSQIQALVGVLIFTSPAATNGYIVAKQMGGDTDLYVDALTWQTVLSLLVLPRWVYVLRDPINGVLRAAMLP